MKQVIAVITLAALTALGGYSAGQYSAARTIPAGASCYLIAAHDDTASLVEVDCPEDEIGNALTATPTPIVYLSATATSTAHSTATRTPSVTPTKVPTQPTMTLEPLNGCAQGYPCWNDVNWYYVVISPVWLCVSTFPCGTAPERQIRMREVAEQVYVQCVFEQAQGGNLWVSESKCSGATMWSAVKYNGKQYMNLVRRIE